MKFLASWLLVAGLAGLDLEAHLQLGGSQLDLRGTAVSDRDLVSLQPEAMAAVRSVLLSATAISDCGLAGLHGLELEELDLFRTSVSSKGMGHLAGLPLRRLTLSATAIDDAGLAKLSPLPLTELRLADTAVGDAGLRHLADMPLRRLDLARTEVTDEGLDALLAISTLQLIDLSFTRVTGEGLKTLVALPDLETLVAIEIPISDAERASIVAARPGLILSTEMPTR